MINIDDIFINEPTFECLSAVLRALPPEIRKQLREISMEYTSLYGFDGLFQRIHTKSVAQIFREYEPLDVKPIASGESEGVRFKLFKAPMSQTQDDSDGA